MRTLVWFRGKDLRIADHVPLREAALIGEVVPVFVLDPFFFAKEQAQKIPHRMQFLLDSLKQLAASLEKCGSRLVVVEGRSVEVIPRLVDRFKANRVAAYGWCDPIGRERDRRIGVTIGERSASRHAPSVTITSPSMPTVTKAAPPSNVSAVVADSER